MPLPSLSTLVGAARERLLGQGARPIPGASAGRRQFTRRMTAFGAVAVGSGLMLPDEVWAGIESRANEFGIVPGTIVGADGTPLDVEPGTSVPFVGEIMLCGWNFAARGWSLCRGQLLAVSSNTALFSLLGTTYGGDGRTTFGLPDLQGRRALGWGNGAGLTPNMLGQKGGAENRTLTALNLPNHHHGHSHTQPVDNSPGTALAPGGNLPAGDNAGNRIYGAPDAGDAGYVPTSRAEVSAGGSQQISIMSPTTVLNYQIALVGQYPSRS